MINKIYLKGNPLPATVRRGLFSLDETTTKLQVKWVGWDSNPRPMP